jgi:LysM repeat protein
MHTTRVLMAVSALIVVVAACGDDDDDASNTVVVAIGGTGPETGASSADADDDEPKDTRDYPSLAEVGRADFTHTIVAGDFLRSIADTYDVEIDDIVGANEWDDGRDHLLLPGDVIYLPADAVMPPETTTTTTAAATDGPVAPEYPDAPNVEWPQSDDPPVCTDPTGIQGVYTMQAGDTEDGLVAEFGISVDELNAENPGGISYESGEHVNVCTTWFE